MPRYRLAARLARSAPLRQLRQLARLALHRLAVLAAPLDQRHRAALRRQFHLAARLDPLAPLARLDPECQSHRFQSAEVEKCRERK